MRLPKVSAHELPKTDPSLAELKHAFFKSDQEPPLYAVTYTEPLSSGRDRLEVFGPFTEEELLASYVDAYDVPEDDRDAYLKGLIQTYPDTSFKAELPGDTPQDVVQAIGATLASGIFATVENNTASHS